MGREFFKVIDEHNRIIDEINKENDNGKGLSANEAVYVLIMYAEKKFE